MSFRHLTDISSSIREIMEIEYSPNFRMRLFLPNVLIAQTSTLYFRYLVWKGQVPLYILCNAVFSHRSILSLLKSEFRFGWWRQVAQWSSRVQRTVEVSATIQPLQWAHTRSGVHQGKTMASFYTVLLHGSL